MKRIAVIGGGAAGCFAAVEAKRRLGAGAAVAVYEAGPKLLAKVAITGGGRCNFTNSFRDVERLEEAYPRGARLIRRAFAAFDNKAVMDWFEREGVPYVIQEDQCVFPKSQDALQIVRTLSGLLRALGVQVRLGSRVESVSRVEEGFKVVFGGGEEIVADEVVVTTGGGALKLLEPLGLKIEKPVPSLFTFKIDNEGLKSLMGAVAPNASLALAGTPFRSSGALLVTDWGVSGPATLKLSSYAARHLYDNGYKGDIVVNWTGLSEAEAREFLAWAGAENARKRVSNVVPEGLSSRLWQHLISRAGLREDILWGELGSKGSSRLVGVLVSDSYPLAGRCSFKAEFVTCGGVSLSEINLSTMESKRYPGLFFAGEVLDIDAITGGFNLQAAWSTAFAVSRNV